MAPLCLTFMTPWPIACQAPLPMGIFQARILECVAISFIYAAYLKHFHLAELKLCTHLTETLYYPLLWDSDNHPSVLCFLSAFMTVHSFSIIMAEGNSGFSMKGQSYKLNPVHLVAL